MIKQVPREVLNAFTSYEPDLPEHPAGKIIVEQIGNGLINHSYKVCCELKPDFFLQRINTNVFQHPEDLQENYISIWQYAEFVRKDSGRALTGFRMPSPVYYSRKATLFVDKNENYWRAFEFIGDSKMVYAAEKATQAKATARAFAKFTAAYDDFNVHLLKEVIPGFHDLGLRYRQFEASLNTELYERMSRSLLLVQDLKSRERYRHFYDIITDSGEFPKRVMHHDAKIGNILFHEQTGKVICPVDYDTVMPGYFFSDLGDMIRSMAGSCDENSKQPDKIRIHKDFYEAVITGYTDVLGAQFTAAEKKYLHSAGLLMIYMQALRFITDYLNGDSYYKTEYPEQNFDRTINQLALLKKLEEFLAEHYRFKI